MRCLPYIICFVLIFAFNSIAQSEHGEDFDYDCELCHEPVDWNVIPEQIKFDHNSKFELTGQHKSLDCRSCHISLVFSKVKSDCISCHTDLHQGTVGKDCSKCHTSKSWMVEDINGLHQQGRFPLLGNHLTAECAQCHTRYVDLYFEPLDVECIACHSNDYYSTQNPNHVSAGFSTDCQNCHSITASEWSAISVVHDFFPLIGGHAVSDCFACHEQGGNFTGLSSECISCHQVDFNSAANHLSQGYPTECEICHNSTAWNQVNFNHNNTNFPLLGAHQNVNCSDCHESGFAGTTTDCFDCHQAEFNATNDPPHQVLNFSHDCLECHNMSGWVPANFNHSFYPVDDRHDEINCNECHSEPNYQLQCLSCHLEDFLDEHNQGDPTDCWNCHNAHDWSIGIPRDIKLQKAH